MQQTNDTSSNITATKQTVAHATANTPKNDLQYKRQSPSTLDPPKNVFSKYHELRTAKTQPTPLTLDDRHNFFLRLPEENRMRAGEILLDRNGTTNRDKVDLTCKALKLQYQFRNAGKSQSNYKIFSLTGGYDCVLMGKIPDLYDRIVDYFKTMLNIQ